jgi:protein TonB
MNDAVSHALESRGRQAEGLQWMIAVSLVAHGAGLAALVLSGGIPDRLASSERDVMTISLGGAAGPQSGGMTPLAGRAVQQVAPTAPTVRPEPVRPAAQKPPEMALPARPTRPVREPATPPRTAPEQARGQTPARGAEARPGSAPIETGARGIGFGLSTGGEGGTGSEIDIGTFCCPDYLTTMLDLIQRNWSSKQSVAGTTTVKFTLLRDGSITGVEVARSSGYAVLDLTAQRAILSSRFPPLPGAYTNDQLTIHLNFQYQR